jgi:Antitoxin MazE-like
MKRKSGRPRAPGRKSASLRKSRAGTLRVRNARSKSSREKVRAYRERMRRRGMKLIQIWVPDPKSPYFAAEARRQSRLLAESPHEKEDQAFIDSITDWDWN